MSRIRSEKGSMLVQLGIAIALLLVIAGGGAYGVSRSRRIQEDSVLEGRAAALDRAQLEFLRRHPGVSLQDSGANAEIRALILRIENWASAAGPTGFNATVLAEAVFDVGERPSTVRYRGRSYVFPRP